jgi:3,4-dihydroxy-2-butanone 4-phosphate synthase
VPGYAFFTATIDCRKMTNGVSGTDCKALTIHALNDFRQNVLIDG